MSGRGWTKGRSLSSTFKEVRKERDRERENTKKGEERERERDPWDGLQSLASFTTKTVH